MESLLELFNHRDTDESKSLVIFDQNYNKMCATGKFRITETDAANIRLCLSGSWKRTVSIKVADNNFMCFTIGDILLGKTQTFNCEKYADNYDSTRRETRLDGIKGNVILAATTVDDLLIILSGVSTKNKSVLECLKEIKDSFTVNVTKDSKDH